MKSFLVLLIIFSLHNSFSQPLTVSSPAQITSIIFSFDQGTPTYSVTRLGREVIRPSKLGFLIKDQQPLDRNFKILDSKQSTFDETWTQPWGEVKSIRNYYNELRVDLQESSSPSRKLTIVFRAYDDGIGFRYEIPEQQNLKRFDIMDELTEFKLTGDHDAWWFKAYQWNRDEYLYNHSPVSTFDTVHTPLTMETKDGLYLSFHEAAAIDYPNIMIERTDSLTLKANLEPWSDGVKVKAQSPMKSPWRTIQMADDPGGLITSYLILNLNEPNKLGDVSWVKPMKYVGIWWGMHIGTMSWSSGEKHGATTMNAKKYIDFAAKYGFDGVLIEGWNTGWDGDWIANGDIFNFTQPYPDFDIKEVTSYAKSKGVSIIGHHETGAGVINYERQMNDAFAYYEKLGIPAVKTGYVGFGDNIKRIDESGKVVKGEWHYGQYMARHHLKVVDTAAKHRITIDIHEPNNDTGLRRTYPNLMSREGARGMEYDAWSEDGGNPPEHTTILPFTRLLAGPMDFTPGIFDIMFKDDGPVDNRSNTTLAKQLAFYVTIYSPVQMAADLPENYEANLKPFQFIRDVPCDWEETRVLHARIGDYITTVRKDRKSSDWYLGSITDENGRMLEASLTFLEPGKKYIAQIYRDGMKADWKTNPLEIEIIEQLVDNSMMLQLRLAPGGGQAIRFKLASQDDLERLRK